jgi:hypothetical protein
LLGNGPRPDRLALRQMLVLNVQGSVASCVGLLAVAVTRHRLTTPQQSGLLLTLQYLQVLATLPAAFGAVAIRQFALLGDEWASVVINTTYRQVRFAIVAAVVLGLGAATALTTILPTYRVALWASVLASATFPAMLASSLMGHALLARREQRWTLLAAGLQLVVVAGFLAVVPPTGTWFAAALASGILVAAVVQFLRVRWSAHAYLLSR